MKLHIQRDASIDIEGTKALLMPAENYISDSVADATVPKVNQW